MNEPSVLIAVVTAVGVVLAAICTVSLPFLFRFLWRILLALGALSAKQNVAINTLEIHRQQAGLPPITIPTEELEHTKTRQEVNQMIQRDSQPNPRIRRQEAQWTPPPPPPPPTRR